MKKGLMEHVTTYARKAKHGLDHALRVGERVYQDVSADISKLYTDKSQDFREFVQLKEKDAKTLADKVTEDVDLKEVGKTVVDEAKKGPGYLKEKLSTLYETKINAKLDAKDDDVAGFWDGYLNIFIRQDCDRRPGSTVYSRHVRYGKAAAVVTAVPVFFSGTLAGLAIGGLPAWVRGWPYFKAKVQDAAEQVKVEAKAAEQAPEEKTAPAEKPAPESEAPKE